MAALPCGLGGNRGSLSARREVATLLGNLQPKGGSLAFRASESEAAVPTSGASGHFHDRREWPFRQAQRGGLSRAPTILRLAPSNPHLQLSYMMLSYIW